MNIANILWNQITSLVRFIAIKPYGDNLLSPGANFWISTVRILVFVMAMFEGLSWSYVGHLLAKSNEYIEFRATGPWLLGAAFFMLVWLIDSALVSLDTYERKRLDPERLLPEDKSHELIKSGEPIPGTEASEGSDSDHNVASNNFFSDERDRFDYKKALSRLWQGSLYAGVAIRIVLAFVSISITAPFLVIYIFNGEITKAAYQRVESNYSAIEKAYAEMVKTEISKAKSDYEAAKSLVNKNEQDFKGELDGVTGTGIKGDGKVAAQKKNLFEIAQSNMKTAERKVMILEGSIKPDVNSGEAVPDSISRLNELRNEWGKKEKDWNKLGTYKIGNGGGEISISNPDDSLGARREIFRQMFDAEKARYEKENNVSGVIRVVWDVLNFPTWDGEIARTERAIISALWLVFGAILLMKIYQPRSVETYYSDYLQSEWIRYNNGVFDHWMLRKERSSNGRPSAAMSASAFERWRRHILPRLMADGDSIHCANKQEEYRLELEGAQQRLAAQAAVIGQDQTLYFKWLDELSNIETTRQKLNSELVSVLAKINASEESIQECESQRPSDPKMWHWIGLSRINLSKDYKEKIRIEHEIARNSQIHLAIQKKVDLYRRRIDGHESRKMWIDSELDGELGRSKEWISRKCEGK